MDNGLDRAKPGSRFGPGPSTQQFVSESGMSRLDNVLKNDNCNSGVPTARSRSLSHDVSTFSPGAPSNTQYQYRRVVAPFASDFRLDSSGHPRYCLWKTSPTASTATLQVRMDTLPVVKLSGTAHGLQQGELLVTSVSGEMP